MITEIRLVSNNAESTAGFWSAILHVPATDLGGGQWRVAPLAGPTVTITTARVVETISRYSDMTVTCDHGAPDRLRELGFEVSHDGSQAVDVNGCDNTVHLRAVGWDGVSEVPWDEPSDEEKARIKELTETARPMRLGLMVLYVPPPSLDAAAKFYGAVLDAEPVQEQHGSGPEHCSVTSRMTGVTIELYPATTRPVTATRLEFRGDAAAAVERLMDRAFALPEKTRDGLGWWLHDPCGNTVVLLPQ